jgi:protein ImuB
MSRPGELYACLYATEFPAQAILRLRPELRGRPCVVMEGEPPFEEVCSLNARARLLGIGRAMTSVEVDTFQGPVVLPRSIVTETAAKAVVLECAGAFSPRIEDRSDQVALLLGLDIAGTQSLFGPPERLARSLLQRVGSLGISARVTIGSNFQAAICLAKGVAQGASVQPIASIAQGNEAAALASLPLAALDLTENQAETFESWGIRTLGMLADLPEKELVARMGQDGRRLRRLARGELPHLFQPVEPVFTLEERMELDTPVELLESLLFVAGAMLDQLILRARARILALASVTIALTLDGAAAHLRIVRPALPTNDKQLWIKLLHLDLGAHPPSAAILAVALHAEPGDTSKVQLGLFSPQLPEATRLDVTLARIRAVVGENNVGRAMLQDAHAPAAFRMEPFTVASGEPRAIAASQPRISMRQLRPPERASVVLQDSRPTKFYFRERRYAVERAYGPWLSGGDWWSPTLWGQEQWDLAARAHDGALLCCCMVRDLLEDRWLMAALYD